MPEEFQQCILVAQSELAAARQFLNTEITNYPTPISCCDAQFNHLLAERQRVLAAIAPLEDPVFVPTPRRPTALSEVESR